MRQATHRITQEESHNADWASMYPGTPFPGSCERKAALLAAFQQANDMFEGPYLHRIENEGQPGQIDTFWRENNAMAHVEYRIHGDMVYESMVSPRTPKIALRIGTIYEVWVTPDGTVGGLRDYQHAVDETEDGRGSWVVGMDWGIGESVTVESRILVIDGIVTDVTEVK